jgi:hypothetical protein
LERIPEGVQRRAKSKQGKLVIELPAEAFLILLLRAFLMLHFWNVHRSQQSPSGIQPLGDFLSIEGICLRPRYRQQPAAPVLMVSSRHHDWNPCSSARRLRRPVSVLGRISAAAANGP